ncbi:hypothetical protein HNR65_002832 [Desulfosalsimonas propionicica]|uniref:Uncharacterized protein n=1 Tax=Desulfosalsimonas propionicica TaxID=332175 RepID=A0A7W0CB42_9BACT|nr:hypothetical protein [Desulfosalsimonas propionicica]
MIRSVLKRPLDKASGFGLSGGFSSVVYDAALALWPG